MQPISRPFILLFTIIIAGSCSSPGKETNLDVVDIVGNLGKYSLVSISSLVSQLEYIPLETNDSNLISHINDILVTENIIFARGAVFCYVFSRDGRFLNEIGRTGKGPGEYNYIGDISINEEKQLVYITDGGSNVIHEYLWTGEYRRSIPIPVFERDRLFYNRFVGDGLFIGSIVTNGCEKHRFCLFDDGGNVIKLFPNSIFYKKIGKWSGDDETNTKIYHTGQHWYLKDALNDTLFCLAGTELTPYLLFDLGKYTLLNRLDGKSSEEWSNAEYYFKFRTMSGTSGHIFFTYYGRGFRKPENPRWLTSSISGKPYSVIFFAGMYCLKDQKTVLLENDPFSGLYGLINDIDGGLSLWPRYCTDRDELVDIWPAEDMKELLNEEYFAGHEIKDREAHQRLKNLLAKLKEEDNPVVVIAKLKQ